MPRTSLRTLRYALLFSALLFLASAPLTESVSAEPDTATAPAEVQPQAVVSSETLGLTRSKNVKMLWVLPGGDRVLVAAAGRAPAGNIVAINTKDGSIAWTRSADKMAVYASALSPDGKILFVQLGWTAHFISTDDGKDIATAKLEYEQFASRQKAAFTPDGKAVELFTHAKTRRINAVAHTVGPLMTLVQPGGTDRFKGTIEHIPGTDTLLLAQGDTGSVFKLKLGETEFKKFMQLPPEKSHRPSAATGDGKLYWAFHDPIDPATGSYVTTWGVHDATGKRIREAESALGDTDMRGAARPLGSTARALFTARNFQRVGAIFDAEKALEPVAYLMGLGDPYKVHASASGQVVAVVTTENELRIYNLEAK